jgi:hypothetical protein
LQAFSLLFDLLDLKPWGDTPRWVILGFQPIPKIPFKLLIEHV